MRPERIKRIRDTVRRRQFDLTVVLENVHDSHNISAVLRSCEAVGIPEIYVLAHDPNFPLENIKLGKRSSAGARKWVHVNLYLDFATCMEAVKKRYKTLYSAHTEQGSKELFDVDFTTSCALVFGNEHDGLSADMRAACDGSFYIPMHGMVRSLNISVSCAVSIYEACRQRQAKGMYGVRPGVFENEKKALEEQYLRQHDGHREPSYIVEPKT